VGKEGSPGKGPAAPTIGRYDRETKKEEDRGTGARNAGRLWKKWVSLVIAEGGKRRGRKRLVPFEAAQHLGEMEDVPDGFLQQRGEKGKRISPAFSYVPKKKKRGRGGADLIYIGPRRRLKKTEKPVVLILHRQEARPWEMSGDKKKKKEKKSPELIDPFNPKKGGVRENTPNVV